MLIPPSAISQVATTYSPYGIVVDATNEKLLGLSVVERTGNINRRLDTGR